MTASMTAMTAQITHDNYGDNDGNNDDDGKNDDRSNRSIVTVTSMTTGSKKRDREGARGKRPTKRSERRPSASGRLRPHEYSVDEDVRSR